MASIRLFVVSLLLLGLLTACAVAGVPPMISYQGKLMQPSGAPVPDASYSIQFAIYDDPASTDPAHKLWGETNANVQVKGGLFSVLLGSVTNLPANIFDSANRFFGVKVGADPEMTPRQKMASAAYAQSAGNGVPAGTIVAYAGANPPDGYLLCSGQEVPRAAYCTLFGAIGTAYGAGNGSTTFRVPDLSGRFALGTSSSHALGAKGGSETKNLQHVHATAGHALTKDEMPSHNHPVTDPGHRHPVPVDGNVTQFTVSTGGGFTPNASPGYTGYATTGISIQNTGGGALHDHGNTAPGLSATQDVTNPFTAVNYIIKY